MGMPCARLAQSLSGAGGKADLKARAFKRIRGQPAALGIVIDDKDDSGRFHWTPTRWSGFGRALTSQPVKP